MKTASGRMAISGAIAGPNSKSRLAKLATKAACGEVISGQQSLPSGPVVGAVVDSVAAASGGRQGRAQNDTSCP